MNDVERLAAAGQCLSDLDNEVGAVISEIEDELRKLVCGMRVSTQLDDGSTLAFGKLGGTWCLIVESVTNVASTDRRRVRDMPREFRASVLSSRVIVRLVVEARAQLEVMIRDREQALDAGRDVLAFLGTLSRRAETLDPTGGDL